MYPITDFLTKLLDSSDWPARWHCGTWTDFHGWLYIISDLLIWSAYFTIPLVILKYLKKKQHLRFTKLYFLFAAFILACGSTHFIDAAAFWVPLYRVSALLRFITGVLSWITVFYLIRLLPQAFSLKTERQLEAEIEQRRRVEYEVLRLNGHLEKRTVELEAANKEMEAFTYSVSHDLRAPLRGIVNFATMLEEDYGPGLDEEGRRITATIKAKTIKMGILIDDLLEFSRLGRQHLSKTKINTYTMVREVIEDIEEGAAAEGSGAADRRDSPSIEWKVGILTSLYGDINTIRQVWVNLISNAIKYSRNNPAPRIEIGCFQREGQTVFFIKDNGVGFDPRYTHKLFNVFQRLHPTDQFEGTGVGLALVSKIVSKHGGAVWAEGLVDEGASFYFSIPDNH